jgi:hypothetical protein
VTVTARGTIDRERQPHAGVTVFTEVELTLRLRGPSPAQAEELVAGFQRRCPVYSSLAVASSQEQVPEDSRPPGLPRPAGRASRSEPGKGMRESSPGWPLSCRPGQPCPNRQLHIEYPHEGHTGHA